MVHVQLLVRPAPTTEVTQTADRTIAARNQRERVRRRLDRTGAGRLCGVPGPSAAGSVRNAAEAAGHGPDRVSRPAGVALAVHEAERHGGRRASGSRRLPEAVQVEHADHRGV
uniref:(northern house mosquito) hypothetical protein n=1 Tax=Culex pipiens TaxID=7175 RepID=A0A8D8NJ30_CULPI